MDTQEIVPDATLAEKVMPEGVPDYPLAYVRVCVGPNVLLARAVLRVKFHEKEGKRDIHRSVVRAAGRTRLEHTQNPQMQVETVKLVEGGRVSNVKRGFRVIRGPLR